MRLEDIMKNITTFVDPLEKSGSYTAKIRGSLPDGETVRFDLEVSGCYTQEILEDTITAQLEEIFSCKYHYEVGDYDEDELYHDGGTFI